MRRSFLKALRVPLSTAAVAAVDQRRLRTHCHTLWDLWVGVNINYKPSNQIDFPIIFHRSIIFDPYPPYHWSGRFGVTFLIISHLPETKWTVGKLLSDSKYLFLDAALADIKPAIQLEFCHHATTDVDGYV